MLVSVITENTKQANIVTHIKLVFSSEIPLVSSRELSIIRQMIAPSIGIRYTIFNFARLMLHHKVCTDCEKHLSSHSPHQLL